MREKTILGLTFLVVFLFASFAFSQNFIVETRDDGVKICINKNGPSSDKQLYRFKETLSLGGEEPSPKLYMPSQCLVDGIGIMYVVDEKMIKKIDPNGNDIVFISKVGNGPGELRNPRLICIYNDTLITHDFSSKYFELFYTYLMYCLQALRFHLFLTYNLGYHLFELWYTQDYSKLFLIPG